MSWQIALIVTLLIGIALAICLCALIRWHKWKFLRIPNSVINAHKITPRFSVGSDAK